jgi:hypothetical protein
VVGRAVQDAGILEQGGGHEWGSGSVMMVAVRAAPSRLRVMPRRHPLPRSGEGSGRGPRDARSSGTDARTRRPPPPDGP